MKRQPITGKFMNEPNAFRFYSTLAKLVGEQHGVDVEVISIKHEDGTIEYEDGIKKAANSDTKKRA